MQKLVLFIGKGGPDITLYKDSLKAEFSLLEASGLGEALALLRREESAVCAALLDITAFGEEAADIIRAMRAEPRYSRLPVIVMTDAGFDDARAAALLAGASCCLPKPCGAELMLHCLRRSVSCAEFEAAAAKLNVIMDNISGGVVMSVVKDGVPELLFSNDRYYELFGYTREEYAKLFGSSVGPILEEDAPRMFGIISAVMRTGERITADFRARHKDGGIIWLKDRVSRVELGAFEHPVQLSVLYDITDEKTAAERLRQTDEELRIALGHSGTTICRMDIPSKTLTIPKDIADTRGLPEIADDMPYGILRLNKVHPGSTETYKEFIFSILNGKKSGSAIYRMKLSAGWRWIEARFTTVFSDEGQPSRAIISYLDVTERMEKEAQYRRWQQSMSGRPAQTYSLFRCNLNKNTSYDMEEGSLLHGVFDMEKESFNARAQIYASRRVYAEDREKYAALVNSEYLLASFIRGNRIMSIDYREKVMNRLRWIRLTVELVQGVNSHDVEAYLFYEDINAEKIEEIETMHRAAADPLTGLLNRAAFEAGFAALAKNRKMNSISAMFMIDLDSFKQINDTYGHAIGDETLIEMGLRLRESFRSRDLVCRLGGDEFMVYMPDVTHISAVKEKASLICALLHKSFSLEIQLSASIGVSIFPNDGEDFGTLYRKADAAQYYVKGSGKDNYALYSEDMGEKPEIADRVSPAYADEAQPGGAAPKRRILIVEDNEINRDYLSSLFAEKYIVETAAEGTAALVKLKRYGAGISIVLLDLMMPGMNGFAMLKNMRESIATQSIPVIVVSGMDERETCLKAIREGATDYITKPVDGDLLKLRVEAALGKSENERLRAQNRFLAIQNEEAKRLAEARRHSEELTHALHAAERADIAKTQFLSSMSHEIRTPLNAVIGYNIIAKTELLTAKTEAETRQASMKVMDCLTKSEVASKHLLTIINDVLDMSAIESGKLKVDDSPFDFRSLITSLTVLFFSQAKAKGVNFEVRFEKPSDEWFYGDQLRVNQILTNLLSNAVKFTPEGGSVTLAITETSSGDGSTDFRFVVSDTGIGMTQEYLEHIWTPFEQAEASISRRFGGSGLGLSITKNLVDLMGGGISVESASGKGSKFTVDLTFRHTEQPSKNASYDFSDINALVVDDDQSTCDYIKLLFNRCGARCVTFTTGALAIEAFSSAAENGAPFNMCLVDWRMPQMDGFATISEIRRIAGSNLPVVVVTAYDFSEVADQAETLGINKFISKPLFQSTLFDLLATINGAPAQSAPDKAPEYDFEGTRVLLAEDNNMNMEVAKHILMNAGVAVDSAWNGQEAVDIFSASRPGTYLAILMDVHMPVIDGYQATRTIRASGHPDAKRIPIIAMTADVFAEDIAEAHGAGMNDHVAKPVDVGALLKLLSSYMEEK